MTKLMKNIKILVFCICYLAVNGLSFGEIPNNMVVVVPPIHVQTPEGVSSSLGGYGYNPATNLFYTALFGTSPNIRYYDPNLPNQPNDPTKTGFYSDADGTSWGLATPSDLKRIINAVDIPGGIWQDWAATFNNSCLPLNPAPVTYNGIYYPAYSIGVMTSTDVSYGPLDWNLRKRIITFDLRGIRYPTDQQPDYDTAQDFGVPTGAFGIADWNDVFTSLVSLQNIADAAGVTPGNTVNIGRQAAWATDASKVYFTSAVADTFGGLYSVRMSDKQVRRLIEETSAGDRFYGEPAVAHTSLRDFTGGAKTGDQVIFNGSTNTGNRGGVNCLVDEPSLDPNNPTIYTVLDAAYFVDFIELPDPNWITYNNIPRVDSLAVDPEGNVYFTHSGIGVFRLDLQGRLLCVQNRAQLAAFNDTLKPSSTSAGSTSLLRPQLRTVTVGEDPGFSIQQLMFQAVTPKCVGGTNIYKPLDFTRDNVVNVDDTEFFKTQIGLTRSEQVPDFDSALFLPYIAADLNGGNNDLDITVTPWVLEVPVVTDKDVQVLYTFLLAGDTDFNGRVDLTDFAKFAAGYEPSTTGKDWSEGDFNFDDVCDLVDLVLLAENWTMEIPAL